MVESKETLMNLLMKVKGESEKTVLKLNIIKTKVMTNRRGKVETVTNFLFLGSKITADGDCSHEIKRFFSLEGKL